MKCLLKWGTLLAAAAVMLTSCGGGDDPAPEPGPNPGDPGAIVLTADKEFIYNDGQDMVTFTVKQDGEDVTSQCTIRNKTAGQDLGTGVNTFTSTTNGQVEFTAKLGDLTSDAVAVEVREALRISADKRRLMPDGTDKAILSVMYANEDVTAQSTVRNVTQGMDLVRDGDGNYSVTLSDFTDLYFTGSYNGRTTEELMVGPMYFFKSVSLWRVTGTWCQYCYQFSNSLLTAEEEIPGRFTYLSIHSGSSDGLDVADGLLYASAIPNAPDVPRCYLDLRREMGGETSGNIKSRVNWLVSDYPAHTGIKATSSLSGRNVTLDVNVKAIAGNDYSIGVALMQDGLIADQNSLNGVVVGVVHYGTLRKLISGSIYGDSMGNIAMGGEATKRYTYTLPSNYVAENCKFFMYVTYKDGDKTYIDNCTAVPVNGSVDYKYEE